MPEYIVKKAKQLHGKPVKEGDVVELAESEAAFLVTGGFIEPASAEQKEPEKDPEKKPPAGGAKTAPAQKPADAKKDAQ